MLNYFFYLILKSEKCLSEGFINAALMNPALLAQIPLGEVNETPTDISVSNETTTSDTSK